MADTASDERKPSDTVCEIADVPVSFTSDVWKNFGFPVARNGKG